MSKLLYVETYRSVNSLDLDSSPFFRDSLNGFLSTKMSIESRRSYLMTSRVTDRARTFSSVNRRTRSKIQASLKTALLKTSRQAALIGMSCESSGGEKNLMGGPSFILSV